MGTCAVRVLRVLCVLRVLRVLCVLRVLLVLCVLCVLRVLRISVGLGVGSDPDAGCDPDSDLISSRCDAGSNAVWDATSNFLSSRWDIACRVERR